MKTPQIPALPGMTPLGIKPRRRTTGAIIARWQSRNAKYWLELYTNANGSYGFTHDHGGGYIGFVTRTQALDRMNEELASYAIDQIVLLAVR
jgi:hypothetical protein